MSDEEAPPQQLGRYQVQRRIGAGGMAEVFLAKATGAEGIEKVVVVKRVLPTFARSSKFIAMFLEEASIATRLNHPNIVQVYNFEQVKGQFLLAMELVDGLDLGRLVSAARRKGSRIPYELGAYIVQEVAKGLDYAHRRRDERGEPMEIVHRDVSPQNVLLSYDGVVKVADFGIAKARLVTEETGVIKGKFSYMSPEQARGEKVDGRSDVYSLGILLGELLMDRVMYPGLHGLDVLEQVRKGRMTAPETVDPNVPVALADIVRRATAYDREARYPSAREMKEDLARFLHRQEQFVDAATLETLILELVPRETTSPEAARDDRADQTAATVASAVANADREQRERRQVVVIAGHARAASNDEASFDDEAARVLSDIAYKSDAVLTWPDGSGRSRFRLILGLRRASVHDPLRAMTLALDIVDALSGVSEDRSTALAASIGVSRGVVSTVRDGSGRLVRYDPIGSVLEVAQSLADEGQSSEILVSGEVYRLARQDFAFDEAGGRDVELDSQSTDVAKRGLRAHHLRGKKTREEKSADARPKEVASGIIGRTAELEALAEAWRESITEHKPVYVAVTGELGVGKTRLVAAAIEAFAPTPRVLHGEAAFGTGDVPFAMVSEVVRAAMGIAEDTPPVEARRILHERAETIVPDPELRRILLDGFVPLLAPDAESAKRADLDDRPPAVAKAARLLLSGLASQAPLVVWLDSLQWADAPSLELVGTLLAHQTAVPLLAILSSRPDARIDRILGRIPHIEVSELGDADGRAVVRLGFGGAQVPPDVESAIMERAGGNPFFLLELVEALVERGVVKVEGHGEERRVVRQPDVPMALPTTLEGVIAARLDELSDDERRAIRWLAAAGAGLSREQLALVSGMELGQELDHLVVKGLVARSDLGTYSFPSAVVRHVAYETTDEADRITMHRRIGKWLAADAAAPPARVARHLERAGDREAAAERYLVAAHHARAMYGNRDALRFFARALALLPPGASPRFFAHEAREQILRGMGRPSAQLLELDAMRTLADRLGDPRLIATAYSRLARFELDQVRTAGVDALLARALSSAIESGERGAEVEARRLSGLLCRELGDMQRALEHCDRALLTCGDDRQLYAARGSVLVQKAEVLRRLGRLAESLEVNAEAVVIFRRLGIKRNESFALSSLGLALASIGEWEDAASIIRASIAIDREIGDRMHVGRKLSNVGQLHAELGDARTAVEMLERADRIFDLIDDDTWRPDTLAALAEIRLEVEDDVDGAAERLDHARRLAERSNDRYDIARERIVRTQIEVRMGRLEQAETAARDAVHVAASGGIVTYQLLAQALLSEVLARGGKAEEARATAGDVEQLLAVRGSVERGERVHLALARAYETLGDAEAAQRAFAAAYREVESRLERIRQPEHRERYLKTPVVQAIRSML